MNLESQANVELSNHRVVAVDGGTATGKGRLIEEISGLLRLKGVPVIHLSTGSLYRAVAYAALEYARTKVSGKRRKSAAEINAEALKLIRQMPAEQLLELAMVRRVEMHGGLAWIDGVVASEDEQLKAPAVGTGASIVSIPLPVRQYIDAISRRQINEFDGYVMIDGRDITNGVVPDAPLKLLLTVAPHIAAERSREHTEDEITARDAADRRKVHGALRTPEDPGDGVIVISTDDHTPETIRDHVYTLMRQVFPELPQI